MPFCGLHKTGGWGAQENPPSSAPAMMENDFEDYDELPDLSFSQATLNSTQNSFMSANGAQEGSSKKRSYDEEIEEGLDAFFNDVDEDSVAQYSREVSKRPIAKMKGSKKAEQGAPSSVGNDFEEAAFLSPLDGMDVDER